MKKLMKTKLIAILLTSLTLLVGCEKDELSPDLIKYYSVSFDSSPGKFFLESGGLEIPANGVSLDVSVVVNYNETLEDGTTLENRNTTLTQTIKTDSAGRMILNIHHADEYNVSIEKFQIQTTPYKRDGKKIHIGQINSLDILIKTSKAGKNFQKRYLVNSATYFWDYVQGFYPIFGSVLPGYETRSILKEYYSGTLVKNWYIKLISDVVLNEI